MKALAKAHQLLADIQTITSNSCEFESHWFTFSIYGILHTIHTSKTNNTHENTAKEINNQPLLRIADIFSNCNTTIEPSEQSDYHRSSSQRVKNSKNIENDEQLSFFMFYTAIGSQGQKAKYIDTKIQKDFDLFFSFSKAHCLENPIHKLCLEANFDKKFTDFLFSSYPEWPEEWKNHYNQIFLYTCKTLNLSDEDIKILTNQPDSIRVSMANEIMLLAHYSSENINNFLNYTQPLTSDPYHLPVDLNSLMLESISPKLNSIVEKARLMEIAQQITGENNQSARVLAL